MFPWYINWFIITKWFSSCLKILFVLKHSLSDINIATLIFFSLVLAWYIKSYARDPQCFSVNSRKVNIWANSVSLASLNVPVLSLANALDSDSLFGHIFYLCMWGGILTDYAGGVATFHLYFHSVKPEFFQISFTNYPTV